jgi:hypothetical protein
MSFPKGDTKIEYRNYSLTHNQYMSDEEILIDTMVILWLKVITLMSLVIQSRD